MPSGKKSSQQRIDERNRLIKVGLLFICIGVIWLLSKKVLHGD